MDDSVPDPVPDPGASPPGSDRLDRIVEGLRPSTVRSRVPVEPDEPAPPPTWPEDGERRPLPDRAARAHTVAALFFAVPFALGLCALSVMGWYGILFQALPAPVGIGAPLIPAALFIARAIYWPRISHRRRAWRLTPEVLDIWQGVLFQNVTSVPRSRVQHTEVGRGPIQRSYDLASLTIHTAGEEHAQVSLSGLETATAEAIRDCLLIREEDHVV